MVESTHTGVQPKDYEDNPAALKYRRSEPIQLSPVKRLATKNPTPEGQGPPTSSHKALVTLWARESLTQEGLEENGVVCYVTGE